MKNVEVKKAGKSMAKGPSVDEYSSELSWPVIDTCVLYRCSFFILYLVRSGEMLALIASARSKSSVFAMSDTISLMVE